MKITAIISSLILLLALVAFVGADVLCGDANGDGLVDVGDVVYLINYIFKSGPAPDPLEAGDANGDRAVDVGDASFLINYVFKGGPEPSGCVPDTGDSVIVPLAIGNTWVTEITEYNSSGQIIDEYLGTGIIVGDTLIEDWTWYLLETDTAGIDTSVTTNKADGLWGITDSTTNPEVLLLKFPATVGETYPLYQATVAVEANDASVTVPAGTFSCYYYRVYVPIFGTIGRVWATPNVGIIRAEEYTLTLFGTYLSKTVELQSYTLTQ